ncbi:MAG: transglycosylase domain-containing protein, partial [Elusimicrobia bacterium]|nr:transglycosylase domain-containing protein [Elusimicrobiota bacterium]
MAGKRRRVPPLLSALAALLLAALGAAGSLFLYAQTRLAPLLSGTVEPDYTSRVYGAPKVLRAGDPLSADELRGRLERLGYASGVPDRPGVYREELGRFEVWLRPFTHPFVQATPVRVVVTLEAGRVASLALADTGAPLVAAALEPEALYEVSPGGRLRRRPLKAGEAPKTVQDAVVSIEDRRFYEHGALDPRGILRAAWRDALRGRVSEGGSTLTQQLAKNLFLSSRRTFSRKAKEALLALYLDARFSKEEILRRYLDTVYFGQDGPVGVFGLAAASRLYFDKEPDRLDLAESATLAGLLASPGRFDPRRDPEASLQRRRVVLAAMRRDGKITPAEERAAGVETLRLAAGHGARPRAADYFLSYVERELEERHPDA